jgi:hypothetical protein
MANVVANQPIHQSEARCRTPFQQQKFSFFSFSFDDMFSSYAYLDQALSVACIVAFFFYRIHATTGFSSVLNNIRNLRLQGVTAVTLLLSLLLMLCHHALMAPVKYSEGFYMDPKSQGIYPNRPLSKYSLESQQTVTDARPLLHVAWLLQLLSIAGILTLCGRLISAPAWWTRALWVASGVMIFTMPLLEIVGFATDMTYVRGVGPMALYALECIVFAVFCIGRPFMHEHV